MTPEEIDTAIAKLEAGLATGTASIEYEGRRVTYRSPTEIMQAIDYFKRLKNAPPATGAAPASADRGSYASFSRD